MILVVGLLPVLSFLAVLLALDSYKLVKLPMVMMVIGLGVLAAGVSYLANGAVLALTNLDLPRYASYISPFIEEVAKATVILILIRRRRIGFLVDAAILGFAVGTGFSLFENLYLYSLRLVQFAGIGTWVVRGFGTAMMHGGATAIFAVMSLGLLERAPAAALRSLWPGLAIAIALHAAFNHAFLSPIHSTAAILLLMPPLFYLVFERSERNLGTWLGSGFDADAHMLELINSGQLSDAPVGSYLKAIKERFGGAVVVDVLCYLRLYTELGLRAKGILLMREDGFDVPVDEATRAKFLELEYLEGSIGKTALLTIHPMLNISHKELWQLYFIKP
jgi:RsiW-degrading membrane proteinase PrsW (M82 family)